MEVYDMLGEPVATLQEGVQKAGRYQAKWDGTKAASGIYIFRLQARELVDAHRSFLGIKKVLLIK